MRFCKRRLMEGIVQLQKIYIALLRYRSILLLYIPAHPIERLCRCDFDELLHGLYFKRFTNKSFLIHSIHVDLGHHGGPLRRDVKQLLTLEPDERLAHRRATDRHTVSNFLRAHTGFKLHADDFITESPVNHLLHA